MCKRIEKWIAIAALIALAGCAGTSPDFSARTLHAYDKQSQLVSWLDAEKSNTVVSLIEAPVCSSTVGHPPQGWAIDAGNWCVVACPVKPANNVFNRWMLTHDGLRCFATDKGPTASVVTEYEQSQWKLEEQVLFNGFDRSFVSDTEWNCAEKEYQIDPDSRRGFWADTGISGNIYRFYEDGSLMIGQTGSPMRFAGDWRGQGGRGVLINDHEVFKFAVNYGGGRFDEFRSATRKQVCRFKDNPGPRLNAAALEVEN